ncbi:CoA ester lyase [Parasphingopyxis algicola]|uniref:HpcH/HpaI aldolase/citrate lyase family protein n=1 Tax=Parasphingopyxis algicola TaxID=2026624 RepID=UPI0015A0D38F|nr:CoA ester lyase [Parasphingopyxis algicola]QLC24661.1 CoA ester lyase [Parasphingopyxis algicola]
MTDPAFRPRRSCLYMPGANARALEKAKSLPADVLIFDLEDAVAPDAKAAARDQVAETIAAGGYGGRELVVRVNGADTEWNADDLAMVKAARPDGLLIPKISRAADIDGASEADLPIWAMIETPLAILNIAEIAAAPRLSAMVMGTNDLAKDMQARLRSGREAFATALSLTVMAARAHGKIVIDGVFNGIGDDAALAGECEQGRELGFDGKTLIHPDQLDAANRIFAPSRTALQDARAIIAAFAEPENAGKGVLEVDGAMVERLHLAEAERLVALAEAIAEREAARD